MFRPKDVSQTIYPTERITLISHWLNHYHAQLYQENQSLVNVLCDLSDWGPQTDPLEEFAQCVFPSTTSILVLCQKKK